MVVRVGKRVGGGYRCVWWRRGVVDFGVRGNRFVVHLWGDYCAGRFCVREEVGVQLLCGRRLSIGIGISAILRLNLGL